MTSDLRLLISAEALRVAGALPAGVTPIIALPGKAPGRFQAAFLSRDLNLGGARDRPAPGFAHFIQALLDEPGLRWLHVNSAGADRPQYKALMARGVQVTTSAGANAPGVAQSAVGAVLALARRFPELWAAQRQREWRAATMPFPPDLQGQRALVVGLGPVGLEVGRLLGAIGLRVEGLSRSARAMPPEGFGATDVYGALPDLLPGIDWLVLCCPLSPITTGLLNASRLTLLPAGACVINVSRGGVVDEAALLALLHTGHLRGAYMDVFEQEPLPPDSPWWDAPNTIVTPHAAGPASGNMARAAGFFLRNLALFRSGQPMLNRAEP